MTVFAASHVTGSILWLFAQSLPGNTDKTVPKITNLKTRPQNLSETEAKMCTRPWLEDKSYLLTMHETKDFFVILLFHPSEKYVRATSALSLNSKPGSHAVYLLKVLSKPIPRPIKQIT